MAGNLTKPKGPKKTLPKIPWKKYIYLHQGGNQEGPPKKNWGCLNRSPPRKPLKKKRENNPEPPGPRPLNKVSP